MSIIEWFQALSINSVVMMIMMIFMLVGAIDKIIGNKFGYGEKFDEGLNAIGPLVISMAGVVAVAPILANVIQNTIGGFFTAIGSDPAMLATTILACDMGGYPLATSLAANESIGQYAGLLLGTMMGPTIVFTIPVALGIIKKEDRSYLGAGVLAGMITIPIGCIVGGLVMNAMGTGPSGAKLSLDIVTQIRLLLPVIVIALLIIAGLWFIPAQMIAGFNVFGQVVTIFITAVTAIAIFEQVTGVYIPGFEIMVDDNGVSHLNEGLLTCGQIGIVLAGAFPLVKFITDVFGGALKKVGALLGINETASAGMVANLANNIAMFNLMGDMDPKGKLLNVAFAVSAAFVFGDHLGFTAGANQGMVTPVIVGKLVAGITAIIVANLLSPILLSKIKSTEK